jgi:membrane protein
MVTLLRRSLQSYSADKCAPLAAAIAYYAVFALFPLALLGVSLLGFFVSDAAARRQVVDGISSGGFLGDDGRAALERTLAGVSSARGWIGLVGLITAAWSVTNLVGVVRSALDSVWDVDRPLPLLRAKLRDLLLAVSVGGLLSVSTASTGLLIGAHRLEPLRDLTGPLVALLGFGMALLVTFAAFMVLYRVAPHARLGWGDVWPAAAIAALVFEVGKNALAHYLRNLGHVNALAGSLGAAILFLSFVYYTAQVVLFAAEVAKHRMLVQAGAVPARDPASTTVPASLGKRVQGTLLRLWTVDLAHHDLDLPYAPGRQAATTQQPTNTREEVLFKQHEARARAAQDAGQDDGADLVGAGRQRRGGTPSHPRHL